ncbi:MAG TPA: outer membrane protein assembly factor BamE [Alphaproteobacteria bacterium]|nr:outer membrane protein assembly factor BamE [Alphaproteobacteria bacterium]HAJ45922.1 outer membrane protein assembly factor BamE [Alphaproteobacteria bacterium]
MTKIVVSKTVVALIAAGLLASACAPIQDVRGYIPDQEKVEKVKVGQDTRDSVQEKLGTPSSSAAFGDPVWYYISAEEERYAFFQADTVTRQILAVQFSEDGKVADIRRYGLNDGQVVSLVSRETPTRGREQSLLQELFGGIGAPGSATRGEQPK